jgi:hypothetical protein
MTETKYETVQLPDGIQVNVTPSPVSLALMAHVTADTSDDPNLRGNIYLPEGQRTGNPELYRLARRLEEAGFDTHIDYGNEDATLTVVVSAGTLAATELRQDEILAIIKEELEPPKHTIHVLVEDDVAELAVAPSPIPLTNERPYRYVPPGYSGHDPEAFDLMPPLLQQVVKRLGERFDSLVYRRPMTGYKRNALLIRVGAPGDTVSDSSTRATLDGLQGDIEIILSALGLSRRTPVLIPMRFDVTVAFDQRKALASLIGGLPGVTEVHDNSATAAADRLAVADTTA